MCDVGLYGGKLQKYSLCRDRDNVWGAAWRKGKRANTMSLRSFQLYAVRSASRINAG